MNWFSLWRRRRRKSRTARHLSPWEGRSGDPLSVLREVVDQTEQESRSV